MIWVILLEKIIDTFIRLVVFVCVTLCACVGNFFYNTKQHKPLRKITVAICHHYVNYPFYVRPGVWSGDLLGMSVSFVMKNILAETKCD